MTQEDQTRTETGAGAGAFCLEAEAEPRPLAAVRACAMVYPDAWRCANKLRAAKGSVEIGDWPDYCYLPMNGAAAIVARYGYPHPSQANDIAVLGACIPWRLTKGIYRFDADVTRALGDVRRG